jgi:glycosyltransferase involved in cell wall biosynthesis
MTVAIVVTVFENDLSELNRCLTSCFNQILSPKEVLLINDGSGFDYSNKLIKMLRDEFPSIVYLYKENGGLSSARNHGLYSCNSEYICFIDPDDTYFENKLFIQVSYMEKMPEIAAVCSGSITNHYSNGKVLSLKKLIPKNPSQIIFPSILLNFFEVHGTPNYLFRTKFLKDINGYDDRLKLNGDRDLLYRLSKLRPFFLSEDIVCEVNKSEFSSTKNLNTEKLNSKLIFVQKIIQDTDISSIIIKSKYFRKYISLNVILSQNFETFYQNIKQINNDTKTYLFTNSFFSHEIFINKITFLILYLILKFKLKNKFKPVNY